MIIPEKVKFVGLIAMLSGVGVLIYQSATQNARLHAAIENIRTAQSLIKSSIDTIESAKGDIKNVRQELKSLQTLAINAQNNLEKLRQERQDLEKTVKETLSNSRQVIREQKLLVERFQQQKNVEMAKVDSISRLVTKPFSPKNQLN
jgi:DNA repair exonuclease SbcCD ATPase subunit